MIKLKVTRNKDSYCFTIARGWPYFIDKIEILSDGKSVFSSSCQSVAIHKSCTHKESIAPGVFQARLFADKRNYANPVHELINAIDLEGERIDNKAMQIDAESGVQGRWLIHDDYNPVTKKEYNVPWSAGCIMLPYKNHEIFNQTLIDLGCKPGDIIEIELKEVDNEKPSKAFVRPCNKANIR
jgi:hypothetical protein